MRSNGRVKPGALQGLCEEFSVTRQAMSKIWKRGTDTTASHGYPVLDSTIKKKSGRPVTLDCASLEARVKAQTAFSRSTFRALAAVTGVSKTTLWRLVKSKAMKRCTSRLKPMLTQKHKHVRLVYSKTFLRRHPNGTLYWHDMLDYVHKDEKWFYMTKVNRQYYLWSDEDVPARKCQSKNHIIKVMFLTAVARPRYDSTKRTHWDGKIGTWAFTSTRQALRNSRNCKRGDDVVEPTTVSREVYRDYLVNKVIPAIRSLWPRQRSSVIWVQQDNARPHVSVDDAAVRSDCRLYGRMEHQIVCSQSARPSRAPA
ncbi:hypothetical protein H257_17391 [Aphanomyces astaci]|uniref:Transposase Tc1-like domain-containing protein n=1 Tax=Aphanomyces astaci TaxID=112090 RepID=W4FF05_APHAT|nr:hypothetical protein H257_17391 [Aphanomyces astaci]ETV66062.1 hypothetical protein H257_17391 [Aphanomyces astaci]|eukprot:XP_009844491.1 hypothetical protein H257_17391 [Aphanomyces astaci]